MCARDWLCKVHAHRGTRRIHVHVRQRPAPKCACPWGTGTEMCMCPGERRSNVLARLARTQAQRPRTHNDYLPMFLDFLLRQQGIRRGISHSVKMDMHDHSIARGYAATCIGIEILTFLREGSRRRVGKSILRVLAACNRMRQHKCPYCSVQGFTETSKEIYADACAGMQPQALS